MSDVVKCDLCNKIISDKVSLMHVSLQVTGDDTAGGFGDDGYSLDLHQSCWNKLKKGLVNDV